MMYVKLFENHRKDKYKVGDYLWAKNSDGNGLPLSDSKGAAVKVEYLRETDNADEEKEKVKQMFGKNVTGLSFFDKNWNLVVSFDADLYKYSGLGTQYRLINSFTAVIRKMTLPEIKQLIYNKYGI